jgi:hypothetical protein
MPSIQLRNVENVHLEGFIVSGMVRVVGGSGIEVRRNTIKGSDRGPDAAISIESGASNVTITDNHVTAGKRNVLLFAGTGGPRVKKVHIVTNDLGGARSDAIQIIGADDVVIEQNLIHDLNVNPDHNDGVQSVDSTRLSIIGNTFTSPGQLDADQGIMLGPMPGAHVVDSRIENNVIHDWRGVGININGAVNTAVVNNSVTATGQPDRPWPGLNLGEVPSPGLKVWNNILSSISRSPGSVPLTLEDHNCVAKGGTGAHDVAAVPVLTAATGFALTAKSPCIGAGTADGAPALDRFGARRTRTIDAGAVAFHTTDHEAAARVQAAPVAPVGPGQPAAAARNPLGLPATSSNTSGGHSGALTVAGVAVAAIFIAVFAAAVLLRRRTHGGT